MGVLIAIPDKERHMKEPFARAVVAVQNQFALIVLQVLSVIRHVNHYSRNVLCVNNGQ